MKKPKILLLMLAAASFAVAPFSHAVETDPVGYVSFTVADGTDLKIGSPLQQPATFSGVVSAVSSSTLTLESPLPDVTSDSHFAIVTQDANAVAGETGVAGVWSQVVSYDDSDLTVADDLAASGVEIGDAVKLVPFWTLDTLFPDSGGVPASPDPFSPLAQVQFHDVNSIGVNLTPTASYLYYDGSQGGDAGWYNANDLGAGLAGGTGVNPETFFVVRNQSGAPATLTFAGNVPVNPVSSSVLSRSSGSQDSLVFNPYPSPVSLDNSNLLESGAIRESSDPFSPIDQLLLFSDTPTGINTTPVAAFLYYDGSQGGDAGWYDANDLAAGPQGQNIEIPSGGPMLIRRSSGNDELIVWTPDLPYTL